jgi:hypothetical protein
MLEAWLILQMRRNHRMTRLRHVLWWRGNIIIVIIIQVTFACKICRSLVLVRLSVVLISAYGLVDIA